MHDISEHRAADISGALHNHERHIPDEWSVQIGDTHYTADINGEQGLRTIVMDDETDKAALDMEVLTSWKPGQELVRAFVDNDAFNFKARKIAEGYMVWHRGCEFKVAVRTPRGAQLAKFCLLYTSPSPRDRTRSRMPSSA